MVWWGKCVWRAPGFVSAGTLLLALFLSALAPAAARAQSSEFADVPDIMASIFEAFADDDTGREVWTGADIAESTWLVFSGFTYAPSGGIFDNGPRLRIMSGYGEYELSRLRPTGRATYAVEKTYIDVLLGYQQRISELTMKVFVGATYISHDAGRAEALAPLSGDDLGIKAMIELWLNIGEMSWASLDAAWAAPFDTTNIRARIGQRVLKRLSLGSELALNLDESSICSLPDSSPADCSLSRDAAAAKALIANARAGFFARYDWVTGETSLSVGALSGEGASDGRVKPYATVQYLTQF